MSNGPVLARRRLKRTFQSNPDSPNWRRRRLRGKRLPTPICLFRDLPDVPRVLRRTPARVTVRRFSGVMADKRSRWLISRSARASSPRQAKEPFQRFVPIRFFWPKRRYDPAPMMTVREITGEIEYEGEQAVAQQLLDQQLAPGAFSRSGSSSGQNSMWVGAHKVLRDLGLRKGDTVSTPELAAVLKGGGLAASSAVSDVVDLTFSVSDSVSWLWAQGASDVRSAIEQSMLSAADQALEHLMRLKPSLSPAEWKPAAPYAAALVLHAHGGETGPSEQAPMPLLHVHCLIGSHTVEQGAEPSIEEALDEPDALREIGALGRLVVADALVRLGFQVEPETGPDGRYFEVAGVPLGLLQKSARAPRGCAGPGPRDVDHV